MQTALRLKMLCVVSDINRSQRDVMKVHMLKSTQHPHGLSFTGPCTFLWACEKLYNFIFLEITKCYIISL